VAVESVEEEVMEDMLGLPCTQGIII